MSDVPEFGRIPTVDEDPLYRLNVIANPLGHTADWQGEFFRICPTGAVDDHQCLYLGTDFDDAKRYLDDRAGQVQWTLDMQDPRYTFERSDREDDTTSIVLVDVKTGRRHAAITGGLISSGFGTAVNGFYVTTEAPPSIGRWYR